MDLFSDDLAERAEATVAFGRDAYGEPRGRWPGAPVLAAGYARLRGLVGSARHDAATATDVLAYGAWNAPVLFLGLSAGTQDSPLPREHEHVIGCPDFYLRPPHAPSGNPFLPTEARDLAADAMRHAPAFRPLRSRDAAAFDVAAGSAALVLNLSRVGRPSGSDPPIDPTELRTRLERHLTAFRPHVVVALKMEVLRRLRRAYGRELPAPESGRTAPLVVPRARFGEHAAPLVVMPVHPNCKPPDRARYNASRRLIAEVIGDALRR